MTTEREAGSDPVERATRDLFEALTGAPDPEVLAALEFARASHARQTRLARPGIGPLPYVVHPIGVATLCARWREAAGLADAPRNDLVRAALLHDVLEDCPVSADELQGRFGPNVAAMVLALTKPGLRTRESAEGRMRRFSQKIAAAGPAVAFLKLCDLIDNLTGLETTPHPVLRRAVDRGREHYQPLLRLAGLADPFHDRVETALRDAEEALSRPEPTPTGGGPALGDRMRRTIAEAARGKLGVHDVERLLREICGVGRAAVARFPREGPPVVVAGELAGLDPGRLRQIRDRVLEAGHATRLPATLLRTNRPGAMGEVGAAYAAVDHGLDGTDTLVVWALPKDYEESLPAGFSATTLLFLALSVVLRPATQLHRDVAKEALALGIELDLDLIDELGILRGHLRMLARWRHLCSLASERVEAELVAFVHSQAGRGPLWHRVRVERRVKTFPSILGKFAAHFASSWPDFSAMEDIGGVRVIVPTTRHLEACLRFLEESAATQPLACPLRRYDREPTADGYRGVHAIRSVRLPGEPAEIRCEVQLRTFLQDAWSTLSHTVAYKLDDEQAGRRREALRALSAQLQECELAATEIFGGEAAATDP